MKAAQATAETVVGRTKPGCKGAERVDAVAATVWRWSLKSLMGHPQSTRQTHLWAGTCETKNILYYSHFIHQCFSG
jgi:hypothetical protein